MPEVEKVEAKPAEGTKDAAGGDKPGEKKEVPFNEHPRWKEVYGELQDWKKLGASPADISARLQEANDLKAALEQAATEVANETGQKQGEDAANKVYEQARAELRKLFPEIDRLSQVVAAHDARSQRLERAALTEQKKIMSAAGLDVTDRAVGGMSDILADIIKNDPDLAAEYDMNPRAAVRGAWDQYTSTVKSYVEREAAAKKQKDAETRRNLPRAHGGGGGEGASGGDKPPAPAKNLLEAEERVKARLKGMME